MPEYKPVPVHVAKQIADQFDKSMVVILCFDPLHELMHTTTYGTGAFEKENAAAAGVICTEAVGADLSRKIEYEDFHRNYDPARFKEALEVLTGVDHALSSLLAVRDGISDELLGALLRRVRRFTNPQSSASVTSVVKSDD